MTRYAEDTKVPVERSRAEIERTLARYGATQFAYAWEGARALIAFAAHGRQIRFELALPDRNDFARTPGKALLRKPEDQLRAWEQACRQRWRALALAIKAKLEMVEAGISSFEDEFLAHVVVPGTGQTMGQWAKPQIAAAYEGRGMPRLLAAGGET